MAPSSKKTTCSICKTKPVEEQWRPFCSKRCADIDLSRWLGGNYAIAGGNADADEDGDDNRAETAARQFERQFSDRDNDN